MRKTETTPYRRREDLNQSSGISTEGEPPVDRNRKDALSSFFKAWLAALSLPVVTSLVACGVPGELTTLKPYVEARMNTLKAAYNKAPDGSAGNAAIDIVAVSKGDTLPFFHNES